MVGVAAASLERNTHEDEDASGGGGGFCDIQLRLESTPRALVAHVADVDGKGVVAGGSLESEREGIGFDSGKGLPEDDVAAVAAEFGVADWSWKVAQGCTIHAAFGLHGWRGWWCRQHWHDSVRPVLVPSAFLSGEIEQGGHHRQPLHPGHSHLGHRPFFFACEGRKRERENKWGGTQKKIRRGRAKTRRGGGEDEDGGRGDEDNVWPCGRILRGRSTLALNLGRHELQTSATRANELMTTKLLASRGHADTIL
jgi:hypothetical protein